MQKNKPLKIIFLTCFWFFTMNATAAVVMNNTGNMGASSLPDSNQGWAGYKKMPQRHTNRINSEVIQPSIAKPVIAGLKPTDSDDDNNGVVYRLKKKLQDRLGGSGHQNHMINQYLGRNY